MKITLKEIDFKKSSLNKPTISTQLKKCKEEDIEFYKAIKNDDVDNIIEEFHDRIMSSINLLQLMGIPMNVIVNEQVEHFNKLISRGIVFKEYISIRKCSNCNKYKDESEFGKRTKEGGFQSYCKSCKKISDKRYRTLGI